MFWTHTYKNVHLQPIFKSIVWYPVIRIQDPVTPGYGIRDEHPGSYFRELMNNFWVKNTEILWCGSGSRIRNNDGIPPESWACKGRWFPWRRICRWMRATCRRQEWGRSRPEPSSSGTSSCTETSVFSIEHNTKRQTSEPGRIREKNREPAYLLRARYWMLTYGSVCWLYKNSLIPSMNFVWREPYSLDYLLFRNLIESVTFSMPVWSGLVEIQPALNDLTGFGAFVKAMYTL